MTNKKNIFSIIVISLISLTVNSCHSHDDANKTSQSETITIKNDEFKQVRDSSNALVIKRYDLGSDSSLGQDLSKVIWQDTIKDLNRLQAFGDLFNSVENSGYCCCAKTHYTLTFYSNRKELATYYVDTADIKNEATVFTNAYQNSYIIPLKSFNSYASK